MPRPQFHKRNFRYENAWQLEPGFKDVVTDSWNQRVDCSLIPRLNACAEDMTRWSRDHCRKLKTDIEECQRQLHNIRLGTSGEGQVQMVEIRKRMIRLLAQDDAYWLQRAKTHWYRDGDRNTKFFHAFATVRKKVNRILSLEDDTGNKVKDSQGMRMLAQQYFHDLFQRHDSVVTPIIGVVHHSVSAEDNNALTAPFIKDEFYVAMFSMHLDE